MNSTQDGNPRNGDQGLQQVGLGRRLFSNVLYSASGRLAALLVWVLFMPAILRALGSERFAVWSLFYALTGYFAAFDFGLVQGTLRGVAAARGRDDPEAAGAMATLAVIGYTGLALLWLIVVNSVADQVLAWLRIPPQLAGSARLAMVIAALVLALSGVWNVTMAVAQGYGRFDLANAILLLTAAQQAVGLGLVLSCGWGLQGLFWNAAAGVAFGGIFGVVLLLRAVPAFRWSSPWRSMEHLGEVVRFGGPMQAANILGVLNAQMDKVLLARIVGLAAVTHYELGSRIVLTVTSLPQLLLAPVMSEAAGMTGADAGPRRRELFDRAGRYYLTAVAACTAPLLAAAPRLLAVWLGAPQPEAARVLQWLACAAGLSLATGMATTLARALNRTDLEAYFAVATVGAHLALSLLLIPRFGLPGALAASVISYAGGSLLFMILFGRMVGWSLGTVLVRPWFVPVAAVASGWACGSLLDRIVPRAAGAEGWWGAAAIGGVAALVPVIAAFATGFLPWREARTLIRGRLRAARR